MKREHFLKEYLGALGAHELVFSNVRPETISGTAIYDPNDPEERQDFCWHMTEADVPSDHVCRLAALIHKDKLLYPDKLTVTRETLRQLYNKDNRTNTSPSEFDIILNTLEEVRVRMVDDGEQTDTYFIHE